MRRITQQDEVTREVIGTRCERGAEIARMLELPEATQAAIRALDEHWDGAGQPLGLRGEEIPLLGRILCLAQTLEVFVRTVGLPGALAMALKRRGRWFDPALVDALLSIRDDRRFWGPFEDPRMVPAVAAWEPADRVRTAGDDELDRVADAFARVIDAKSPFTARHSSEVARWAVEIGAVMGESPDGLRDLRRAGLLHDVGKLAVSSRILDKPGKLDPEEMAAIREHPRYTHQILARVACFSGIVETAANHHERLDGNGLPPRPVGLRPLAPGAHPRGGGHLRGADRRPPVPRGDAARARAGDRARAARHRAVPGGRRRARGGGHGAGVDRGPRGVAARPRRTSTACIEGRPAGCASWNAPSLPRAQPSQPRLPTSKKFVASADDGRVRPPLRRPA